VAAVAVAIATAPSVGATGVDHGAVVSATPRGDTPQFLNNEVLAGLQVGNRIVVGGNFTQVRDDTFGVVNQPNLAAYDLTTGRLDLNFLPSVNGEVRALADAGNGTIIAVGTFSSVNGVTRKKIVKLRLVDGSVVTQFSANADAGVNDVAIANGKAYVGGQFSTVKGIAREGLAAVDLTTGNVDTGLNLPVTQGTGINGGGGVRAVDVTPNGNTLVSAHNAHQVAGQVRQGLALIDISGPTATLLPWRTDHYDYDCSPNQSVTRPVMRDVQFSPNGSYLVVVTSIGNYAPGCDVAVRFPTAGGNGVTATWISRLFDTPETVAVTDQAIYVGGHMRWLMAPGTEWDDWNNGNTNNQPNNTLVRDQIGDLSISDGTALPWNPGATGLRGVLDLKVTEAGLLAGSDGEWFGGRQTYRHALFELPAGPPPADNANPVATVGAPSAGATLDSPVAFSGTATDDAGVVDVLVSLRNMGTMQYQQLDGTFNNDGFVLHNTFVPGSGDTSTSWQWTADLPNGNYRLTARAEDVAGKRGAVVTRDFNVGTVADTQDPNGTITTPTAGQTLTSNTVNSTGTATDDISVSEVSLIVKNRDTKEFLGQGAGQSVGARRPYDQLVVDRQPARRSLQDHPPGGRRGGQEGPHHRGAQLRRGRLSTCPSEHHSPGPPGSIGIVVAAAR
jgi:trimeric autotransporter adhesin